MGLNKFLLAVIVASIIIPFTMGAIPWHDCCAVEVDDAAVQQAYEEHKQDYCRRNFVMSTCEESYAEAIETGMKVDADGFRRIVITETIAECEEKNAAWERRFNDRSWDQLPIITPGISEFYSWFTNPFYESDTMHPLVIDHKWLLWKYPRPGTYTFTPADSRFAYLKPKLSYLEVTERYIDAYVQAEQACNGGRTCMKDTIDTDRFTKDWIIFSFGAGDVYGNGLQVCEEILGQLNDDGLVKFPGQPSNTGSCETNADGCCEGYHRSGSVCCSDGYEAEKTDTGYVCSPADAEDRVVSVIIDLEKDYLIADGEDAIDGTLTYWALTPGGQRVPYANKNIYRRIVAEADTPRYQFSVEKESQTDEAGKLDISISLAKGEYNVADLGEPIPVQVYTLDQPLHERDDTQFMLEYGDGVQIEEVRLVGKESVAQNTGARLRITVSDPLNELKRYTITSGSGFRVDGEETLGTAYTSTKENEITIGWYSPKISEELRMDYGKRIGIGVMKMGMTAAEDYLGNALGQVDTDSMSTSFQNAQEAYEKGALLLKADMAGAQSWQVGTDVGKALKGEGAQYGVAKAGVGLVSWVEGSIGFITNGPTSPLKTVTKVGLTGLQEWYATVDQMEKIGKSKTITVDVPITVTVEGVQTSSTDTMTIHVPVTGYQFILGGSA